VPGEYLNELDPHYFDSRGNPPEEQVLEKLYYQPCAGCGRPSNDPLCKCSESPHIGWLIVPLRSDQLALRDRSRDDIDD
jgi:hypothetical protein